MSTEKALIDAIRSGDVATVMRCLDGTTLVHWRDANGCSGLFHAVFNRKWPVVEALLARGADIDLADHKGWTPLFWAAFNGHADIVGPLIAMGADANKATLEGDLPLFMSAYKGHADVVRLLLSLIHI